MTVFYTSLYARLVNTGRGEYSARKLRKEHGFTRDDIKYLDAFLERIQGKGLSKELVRRMLIFKDGCYSVSDYAQLVPIIVENRDNCFTVSQLGEYTGLLPFFIERGLVKEGCIDGKQVYFLARNPAQDEWFHKISAEFESAEINVAGISWFSSVSFTSEVRKVTSKMIYDSDHVFLEQVYLMKCRNGWQLTAYKPDSQQFNTWFTVRVTGSFQVDIPPMF
ncbi:MAG: hypothetical protein ACFFD4_40275 [Candidatus Odinarchaeota archaeon]